MLEYKDDKGNLVKEYTFEDFENGLIGGNIHLGKCHVTSSSTGDSWYEFMSYENYELIKERRIELYNAKAEKQFLILKTNFAKELEKSDDKNRLIEAEINFCEYAFYPEKRATLYVPHNERQDYSDLYHTIIVRGKKDYNSTNSPSCQFQVGGGDGMYIRIESLAKYYNWLKHIKNETSKEVNKKERINTKTKLDFTIDKLTPIIIGLAKHKGYQKPSIFLDELLKEVKEFNDFEFECDFFLNVHYICQENAKQFWNQGHRKDITAWFSKAKIATDVFNTTWKEIDIDDKAEEQENNFLESTIEDYLTDFKDLIIKSDYPVLVNALKEYFTTGNFPKDCKKIKITGKVNIKKFGWALNQLYRSEKKGHLPIEYLQFAKNKISIFKDVSFDNNYYKKSTLYKYFTTKV